MQSQPRSRPGQQARPGDVTGRKREQLAREHSDEIQARENEISMITAERSRSEEDDIIDPLTREVINTADGSVTRMDPEEEDDAPRLLSTGSTQVEEIPDVRPTGPAVKRAPDPEEKVIIRVNADLEDVTLGYGNTVSFVQGRKYRVPLWVAQHLEDKGLVWGRG